MDVTIACPCPGTPHETDTITFRDRLDFRSAATVRKAVALAREEDVTDPAEILALMSEWYLILGIEAWTLTDGGPIEVSRRAIRERLLENPDAYDQVVDLTDAADGQYMVTVLLPLLVRASKSSEVGPTEPSISPPTDSTPKPPRPSKPSSITSIPTADTGTMPTSPGGDSSTSPSEASVA